MESRCLESGTVSIYWATLYNSVIQISGQFQLFRITKTKVLILSLSDQLRREGTGGDDIPCVSTK